MLLARGPQIVEATLGGELHDVKPFTPEVRAEIDNELVAKSIAFMRREAGGRGAVLPLPAILYGPHTEPAVERV